jgi:hypothetical protein
LGILAETGQKIGGENLGRKIWGEEFGAKNLGEKFFAPTWIPPKQSETWPISIFMASSIRRGEKFFAPIIFAIIIFRPHSFLLPIIFRPHYFSPPLFFAAQKTSFTPNFPNKTTSVARECDIPPNLITTLNRHFGIAVLPQRTQKAQGVEDISKPCALCVRVYDKIPFF